MALAFPFLTRLTRLRRARLPGRPGRRVRVLVGADFVPDLIVATAGEPLRLVFRRLIGPRSAERVVFPALGRSATLPFAEDVPLELLPLDPGDYEFTCQEGLLRGCMRVVPR